MRIAGQAQKELFHNEALQVLDCIAAASVEEPPRNDPPADPPDGATFIIGPTPTGLWSGKAGQLANMSAGGWRYIVPTEGMSALVRTSGLRADYRSGGWAIGTVVAGHIEVGGVQVLGAQVAAIASPSGGSTVDSEARSAIGLMLDAMRQHGLIAT